MPSTAPPPPPNPGSGNGGRGLCDSALLPALIPRIPLPPLGRRSNVSFSAPTANCQPWCSAVGTRRSDLGKSCTAPDAEGYTGAALSVRRKKVVKPLSMLRMSWGPSRWAAQFASSCSTHRSLAASACSAAGMRAVCCPAVERSSPVQRCWQKRMPWIWLSMD